MPQMKHVKRKEANERNAKWAALTPSQQIAELDKRNVVATKQRKKIMKKIEKVLDKDK